MVVSQVRRCPLQLPALAPRTRTVGIVGAGNSARALSCYLSCQGQQVRLYARNPRRVADLARSRRLVSRGQLEGLHPLGPVAARPRDLAETCQTIFVATTADAYEDVARQLGPYLSGDHDLVLFSGKLGGCLVVEETLSRLRHPLPRVIETDALFASRAQDDGSVWIRGIKKWTLYTSSRRSLTRQNGPILERFFPGLQPADNVIQRGLTDFGALAHALTMLVNMNAVDRAQPFLFYYDGFTEKTIVLLETMEREFRSIAEAYGTSLVPARELLDRYYGCDSRGTLLDAMRTVPNYRHSQAPTTLLHRYLSEDVACTLVPAQQLARLAGVQTPMMDAVVTLASLVFGQSFASTGRTLARFGWAGWDAARIRDWIVS